MQLATKIGAMSWENLSEAPSSAFATAASLVASAPFLLLLLADEPALLAADLSAVFFFLAVRASLRRDMSNPSAPSPGSWPNGSTTGGSWAYGSSARGSALRLDRAELAAGPNNVRPTAVIPTAAHTSTLSRMGDPTILDML